MIKTVTAIAAAYLFCFYGSSIYLVQFLPVLAAFGGMILFRSVLLALSYGILCGSLLLNMTQDQPFDTTLQKTIQIGLTNSLNTHNFYLLLFILLMMLLVCLTERQGSLKSLIQRLTQNIHNRTTALMIPYFAGLLVFFDDYANSLIVGSSTKEIRKRFKISKEKMAFIIDATAAPIAGIAIVSSWVGFEIGLFNEVSANTGIEQNGVSMFLDAMPARFYCILMLLFVPWSILTGIEFGPMVRAEHLAKLEKDSPAKDTFIDTHKSSILRLTLQGLSPYLVLIGLLIFGMWWDGSSAIKNFSSSTILSWQYWQSIMQGVKHTSLIYALSGISALMLALLISIISGKPFLRPLMIGAQRSITPIGIIILAWGLKEFYLVLSPDGWLTTLTSSLYFPSSEYIPCIAFLVSAILAFTTGTSWGTMSILIPTLLPIIIQSEGGYTTNVILTLAAILDGSILGDHCSPISDTTILSATATDCDLRSHTMTQIPYALLVGITASSCGYLLSATILPVWYSYLVCICVLMMSSYLLSHFQHRMLVKNKLKRSGFETHSIPSRKYQKTLH